MERDKIPTFIKGTGPVWEILKIYTSIKTLLGNTQWRADNNF